MEKYLDMHKISVKIERYYSYPDIKRQTPNSSFIWNNIHFTEENVKECDFLIILDYPKNDFSIHVNKDNIFHFCLEPSNEISKYRQFANKKVSKIYNQLKSDEKFILSYPALPWHLDQDYDFLKALKSSDLKKEDKIVWVTSDQRSSIQHNQRMNFLETLHDLPFISLYGRGINPVNSKWDVMKTSKYAIAYENFKNDFNWTEKISDCFLSYTIPLYYGCDRINDYFNDRSIIQIDPKDKYIKLKLKEIVNSNYWHENLDALIESRNLILEKYQMFSLFEKLINQHVVLFGVNQMKKRQLFEFKGQDEYFDNYPFDVLLEKKAHQLKKKIKNKFNF